MDEQQPKAQPDRHKGGRPKSKRPQRVMVSVPGTLAPVVKELVRVYRENEKQL